MPIQVHAATRPEIPPFSMPDRFRHDIAYFMNTPGEGGAPVLPPGEYWISADKVKQCLDEGVIRIVSPLDAHNQAELELSEEQEEWLEWMLRHNLEHVRLV